MPITESQVFETANSLKERGIAPSALSIREITKTGSLGTIQKYLRQWREGAESVVKDLNEPPPTSAMRVSEQFLQQVWGLAIHHARQEGGLKLKEIQNEKKEIMEDAAVAWKEVEKLEGAQEKLGEDVRALEDRNLKGERDLEQTRNRLQQMEDAYASLFQEKELSVQELGVLKKEHENSREQREELRKNRDELLAKVEGLRIAAAGLEKDVENLKRERHHWEKQFLQARGELEDCRQLLARKSSLADHFREERGKLDHEKQKLTEQLGESCGRFQILEKRCLEYEQQVANMGDNLKQALSVHKNGKKITNSPKITS